MGQPPAQYHPSWDPWSHPVPISDSLTGDPLFTPLLQQGLLTETLQLLTFWRLEFMSCLLKPARRVDVRGVSIQPEIMTLRVAIKVEAHPVTTHLPTGRAGEGKAHGNLLLSLVRCATHHSSHAPFQHST